MVQGARTTFVLISLLLAALLLCLPYSPALAEDGATLIRARSATVETIDTGKYSVGDHVAIPDSCLYCTVKDAESHTLAIGGNEGAPVVNLGSNYPVHAGNGLTEYPPDHKVTIPATVVDSDGVEWTIVEIAESAFMAADNNSYINDVVIEGNLDTIGDFAFAGLMGGQHTPSFKFKMLEGSSVNKIAASAFNYVETDDLDFPEGSNITLVTDRYGTANNRAYYTHCNAIGARRITFPKSYSGQIYQCSSKHSTKLVNSSGVVTPQLNIVAVLSPYATFAYSGLATRTLTKAPTSFDIVETKRPDNLNVLVWSKSPAEASLVGANGLDAGYSAILHMAVLEDGFTIGGVAKPSDVAEPYGAQTSNVKLNNAVENVINGTTEIPDGMLSVMNGDEVEWTLSEGADYTVNYYSTEDATTPLAGAPDMAGAYWVEFVGNEKTAWGTTPRYKLVLSQSKIVIGDSDVELAIPEGGFVYDGAAKEPKAAVAHEGVPLTVGIDYEVTYADNTDVGTATVTITGIGAYAGAVSRTFEIAKCPLADSGYALSFANNGGPAFTYCGSKVNPQVVLAKGFEAIPASEYSVSYTGELVNCTPSDAPEKPKVIVTMNDESSYVGSASLEFTISQADISAVTTDSLITGETSMGNIEFTPVNNTSIGASVYTGSAQSPDIPQLLLAFFAPYGPGQVRYVLTAEDYKADAWSDNINVGEASIALHGQGNFKGDLTLKHTIEPASMESVEVAIEDQVWTGGAIEPTVSAKLGDYILKEDDYSVAYEPSDLTTVGTVVATLAGKGNFKDSKTAIFMIRKPIEDADVQVADQDYTGQELTPDVTVKLGDSQLEPLQDYTVSFENNVNIGTATVIVTGVDNYMGTVTKDFTIKVSAEDQAALDSFAAALGAIGTVTAESKDAVEAARTVYDNLSETQKSLVSAESVKALDDAEQAYAKAIEEKAAADKTAAAKAVEAIDAIGQVTADSDEAVKAARDAYDNLTDDQKALVDPAKLEALKSAEEAYAKAAAAKAKADADAKAKADAAAKAAASNINTATVTAAQVKKASNLGVTTITLGKKVKKIAKGAFKGAKITTIVVKTKKLKKKSVKGSLKGSKVKTVKVSIGSKKVNKKYVKKYKKIFTKKNAGKKAKVRKA